MSDEATVWIRGNIANDAEPGVTGTGKKVANFRVAVNKGFGESRSTTYVPVVVWEEQAEEANTRARTGVRVHIEGRYATRSYDSKKHPGEKVYITEVVAERIRYFADEPEEDLASIKFD